MTPALAETAAHRFGPAAGGPADALVVLLHGVGSSAAAMAPLAEAIARRLPGAAIVVPDGFDPFDRGAQGFQWFSIAGVTEGNRAQRIAAALPRLAALIAGEQRRAGLGAERTAVVGFSQGAIMALHLAASDAAPAAVVSLAGRLAGPVPPAAARPAAILLSHGLADPVIAPAELDRAASAFRAAGHPVEAQAIPGHGHGVHPQQVLRLIQHLDSHLPKGER